MFILGFWSYTGQLATEISWWIRVGEIVDSVTVTSGCRWPRQPYFKEFRMDYWAVGFEMNWCRAKLLPGVLFSSCFGIRSFLWRWKILRDRGVNRKYFSRDLNRVSRALYPFRNNGIFNCRINEEFSLCDTLTLKSHEWEIFWGIEDYSATI